MAFLLRRDQNAQQQANELAARLGRLEAESPSQSVLKLGDHGLITDEALAEPLALASRCRRSRQRESPPVRGLSLWAVRGSNTRPPACKAGALPTELTAHAPSGIRTRGPEQDLCGPARRESSTGVARGRHVCGTQARRLMPTHPWLTRSTETISRRLK
jgi:hypothetical protein